MGQMTDATIAAWQQEHGIEAAAGERLQVLTALSALAFELIKVVELERSGIRDGDGYWHGSDPLDGTMRQLGAVYQHLEDKRRAALPPRDESDDWLFGSADEHPDWRSTAKRIRTRGVTCEVQHERPA